jgi:hypothetical protein
MLSWKHADKLMAALAGQNVYVLHKHNCHYQQLPVGCEQLGSIVHVISSKAQVLHRPHLQCPTSISQPGTEATEMLHTTQTFAGS